MKRDKSSKPALQPECNKCSRFAIFKAPCDANSCIYREVKLKPDWLLD